ncbi:MAG TPA: PBP1A family penicillin-binding protein [Dissulfurispiraceae bacterium]|nr:PBP1A family penicillin-binding protein [Dissulfurispiraceae bacterium]
MRSKVILISAVLILGSLVGAYLALATGIPSIQELKKHDSAAGTRVYADDDSLIGEIKLQKGIFVPYNQIPENMRNAVVAVEDSRFWKHSGIDYVGIGRALVKDLLHMSLKEGGSTITQQLAKVVFLSSEKTITRKIKEAQLALQIEKELSKKEILELYLNRVYFGHGAYGIEMAARTYFGKSVRNITLAEAAMLAGLTKGPTTYSPFNDLVRAKERQSVVLARMVEEGYIKQSDADAAKKQPLFLSQARAAAETYNYFIDYVKQYLIARYGEEKVFKGDFKVYTTLNKNAQVQAQRALQDGLREVDKRRGWRGPVAHRDNIKEQNGENSASFTATAGDISTGTVISVGPKEAVVKSRGITGKLLVGDAKWASAVLDKSSGRPRYIKNFKLTDILKQGDVILVRFKTGGAKNILFSLDQEPDVEGAVVAVEPSTGYIRALVGGFSFTRSEYNRAVLAQRQPGSSFKPVIYAAALENGFTPASILVDEPVSYPGGAAGDWKPENYDRKYLGPIRLREALAYSRNIVTVKLVEALGVDRVIELARALGIQGSMPRNLSIALGSTSVTPLELTSAFATFANGGIKMKPISIKYITDSHGQVIEGSQPEGSPVISAAGSFQITSMMEDVIRYGTGMRANIGRPAAGKTGTSNDYKDAWFVGYTPDLAAGVWVGFDDMKRSLGGGEVGGRAAAPIWQRFMRGTLSGETVPDFVVPPGIVRQRIDIVTGQPAGFFASDASTIDEYFKEGSLPHQGGLESFNPLSRISPHPSSEQQSRSTDMRRPLVPRTLDPAQD